MTRVLLLRHAETARPDVWHGAESDIGLSERGQRQAEALAPLLAAERPSAVISSAMRRAVLTAEPIAQACAVALQREPLLHERRVGALSQQRFDTHQPLWLETMQRWADGDPHFAPPGSESFVAVAERTLAIWRRLAEQHHGRTYVVVAHGFVIKALLFSLDLIVKDWVGFRCPNLAITEVVLEGTSWRLLQLNQLPESVRLAGLPHQPEGAAS